MPPSGVEELPDPPDAPDIRRGISLSLFQWIAFPILLVLPVLALFGFFGERFATTSSTAGALHASVRSPTVLRYRLSSAVDVNVNNVGAAALDSITIALDTSYIGRFSALAAVPSFSGPFEVGLSGLRPGESRAVRIELKGECYGRHSGALRITAGGADTLRIPLRTTVFP